MAGSHRMRGITLIELMIVVIILGLLIAIGYPSYLKSTLKAKRSDATTALLAVAAAQEKEYLKSNRYSASLADLGILTTESKEYTLTLAVDNDGDTFLATATARINGSQENDADCVIFTIDQTGAKRSTDSDGGPTDDCW
ncbi:MAG: type IV pilin protein [Pseudomonadota bacterium]